MTRRPLDSLATAIVIAAAQLVPRGARSDWIAEWRGELWHTVHQASGEICELAGMTPLRFSMGAMQDAFWLRTDCISGWAAHALRRGSVARCTIFLLSLAILGLIVCLVLPRSRTALFANLYPDARELVVLSSKGQEGTQTPSIHLAEYREWATDTAGLFSQIAFYHPAISPLHLAHHATPELSVIVGSSNLLHLLGAMQPGDRTARSQETGRLFLSRSAWQRWYRSDPAIFGRRAEVTGQAVVIAGVIPDSEWHLPGRADAWLLEDAAGLNRLAPNAKGFVVARIRDSAFPPPRAGWRWMVQMRHGKLYRYACISLASVSLQPVGEFLMALLLAVLALPATTALPLGDYPLSREPLRRWLIARRWLFLGSKFLLVAMIVFLWSTALAFASQPANLSDAAGIEALAAFLPLLIGFRWVLQDQRKRCPVCLCLLSNPARVGQPSCNFLGWSGTELICISGHGLLHIPELPTSWFATQRWLCLDPSWHCLFAEAAATSPESA